MILRDYQNEAIAATLNYWQEESGNPLIDLATGTGKSLVMAELTRYLVESYPTLRIMIATHVKELIEQNFMELLKLWPAAPAGIYSAGVGRRDTRSQILFCGIQSSHARAAAFGAVDLMMVDEAHLIPDNANTMYGRFIADMRAINPDMKVLGLTATPFRLKSGRLDEGENRLFDRVVYTYGIADGVRDGFLAPLVTKATQTGFDLTGVAKSGGEYVPGQLQAACDKAETTKRAIFEAVAYGATRKSWLAFCSGVEHALHVRDAIRGYGVSCETVTGTTPSDERARILSDFKAGRLRCITNNSVLTTGFNAPGVDMILALRPTASASLYVQMMGRGTRTAPGKANCLVLDFAGLIRQHGPVDCIDAGKPSAGGGVAPVKECPDCASLIHASIMICPDCGHAFPPSLEVKISAKASALAIMSTAPAEWIDVSDRTFARHDKAGGMSSVVTKYYCGFVTHKNWLCPEHTGMPKRKADQFWARHGGQTPAPDSCEDWLARAGELAPTEQIRVRPNGKWIEVVEMKPGLRGALQRSVELLDDVAF